ncbi:MULTISPECIES: amino acid ABC transporter permease [unclassified Mycolicibacterium]|uniref:amino acid ABC transporter permease n=1 Tax=unclassified Mycolicibacterium TaxID=2636767 RepID=UPI0012DDDB11|nr:MULTISPECIES: amino acid ABC transporter permease [unclassified Mycolicibacterium]MUL81360.1 amino acid ABC transporter permease [Mycolicibacterium sp. CBMA 329]MUL87126.1 amino acid ABC transporter permease [Mycolicibacterium sp. CBMA 331]MUL98592.1 amino acid ABC transporter permease [Mycolicibacterium sp. CBMA 334]MUM28327.1 amino acid ABC transporter permease [Mycolicibacterium sp. CBMA 295]MUM37423.1 amino acid ABC transporter permease [Mycolicibacterium sp. CBMA 247]
MPAPAAAASLLDGHRAGRRTGTQRPPGAADTGADDEAVVPLRHPSRWIVSAVLFVVVAVFAVSLWQNENINHVVVSRYLFDPLILKGVVLTVVITILSMLIASILAVLLAVMRLSVNPVLRSASWLFIYFFRGTPLMVQVIFWGYLGLLYSQISLGIPFTDIGWVIGNTNALIPAFVAGLLAISLNEAAYSAEIVRAGLLSVDSGQSEAAFTLGMSRAYTLRRVVLPQAMRFIIPPMGNELISTLKNTSLLSLIAVLELFTVATNISSRVLAQVELLIVASFWYLVLTSALSIPQYYLERHYSKGAGRDLPPTPLQRLRRWSAAIPGRGADSSRGSNRTPELEGTPR